MLQNRIAVVTGGSRGIGKAIALALAAAGADIAIVYAGNAQAAAETVDRIEALGRKAMAFPCDVADFAKVRELIKAIQQAFGGVDILVNNAGIVRDGLILTMKEEQYDAVLDVNLKGAFNMIRHSAGLMLRKRAGRIINITSVSGIIGNAGQSNYAAAKAGMIGMTKSVARELASKGITCNAIAPGYIETDMTGSLPEKTLEQAVTQIPLGRMGRPEEVAKLALFLASDDAAYITGQTLCVDGGLSM